MSRLTDKVYSFWVVSILCKIILCLIELELALTGDNLKNAKNTVIQRKCKKYSNFIKNAYISKKLDRLYNLFYLFKKTT